MNVVRNAAGLDPILPGYCKDEDRLCNERRFLYLLKGIVG